MSSTRVVLVTGASRGIGREICRHMAAQGHTVIATARRLADAEELADTLPGDIHGYALDVNSGDSAWHLVKLLQTDFGRIDVLINNAGLMSHLSALDAQIAEYQRIFDTNLYGPIRVSRACLPLLRAGAAPHIINVSSDLAEFATLPNGGFAAYRLSKSALNAYTIVLAAELAKDAIRVNAMNPGWVHTDMGGPDAPGTVAEGADTAIWLASQTEGPTGQFFHKRQRIDW